MSGKVHWDRWGPHLATAEREGMSFSSVPIESRTVAAHVVHSAPDTGRGRYEDERFAFS